MLMENIIMKGSCNYECMNWIKAVYEIMKILEFRNCLNGYMSKRRLKYE